MRTLVLLLATISVPAFAQTTTTRCRNELGQVVCDSNTQQAPDYAGALAAGRALVPNWQQDDVDRERLRSLQLQNQLAERQLTLQSAPSYDAKQCRRSASSALSSGDLSLARDILDACAR